MVNELMPDYSAESFYQSLIPPEILKGGETEDPPQDTIRCILLGQKIGGNIFKVRSGSAFLNEGSPEAVSVDGLPGPSETILLIN